jgi:hypothetical protein
VPFVVGVLAATVAYGRRQAVNTAARPEGGPLNAA